MAELRLQNWKDVQKIDLLKLTKNEGQPWLMLVSSSDEDETSWERYHLNTFKEDCATATRDEVFQ